MESANKNCSSFRGFWQAAQQISVDLASMCFGKNPSKGTIFNITGEFNIVLLFFN